MAISNDWTNKSLKIQQETEKSEAYQAGREAGVNEAMMISMADPLPPGGDTGRHKPNPNQKPSSPYEKGKSPHTLAMMIDPANNIKGTGKKPLYDDKDWGPDSEKWPPTPGKPWQIQAHKGQHYNEHGQPISDPARGFRPDGSPVYLEHMEQTPEEHEYYEKLYKWKFEGGPEPRHPLMISQSPAALDALRKGKTPGLSSKQIRSLIKPYTKQDQFGHPTGSLRV